jgi:hypothetical protein
MGSADEGDALLLVAGPAAQASDIAGKLRLHVGERLGLRDPAAFAFCWVLGFPLFERDPETGTIFPTHHPFTSPAPGQEGLLESDPLAMIAQHYDLVLNGFELGSGSIRIHDAEFQQRIFEVFGLSATEIENRFGFFTKALRYGAPPHGGMAWGIDRLAMLACGETSIREVIAFPKNQVARDLMMDAPSPVATAQLNELGIALKGEPKKAGLIDAALDLGERPVGVEFVALPLKVDRDRERALRFPRRSVRKSALGIPGRRRPMPGFEIEVGRKLEVPGTHVHTLNHAPSLRRLSLGHLKVAQPRTAASTAGSSCARWLTRTSIWCLAFRADAGGRFGVASIRASSSRRALRSRTAVRVAGLRAGA